LPSDDLLNPEAKPDFSADAHVTFQPSRRSHLSQPFRPTRNGLRAGHGRRIAAAILSTVLVGAAVLSTSSATAEPKPTIAEAKAAILKLHHQEEQASEDYNETREQLKSVNVRLAAARTQLVRQRAAYKKAQVKMGNLAAETYRRGEMSGLDLMLGDDPQSQLAQAGYLPSLGQRQTGALKRLNAGEKKLVATEKDIAAQQRKAAAAEAKLKTSKATVERRLAEAKAELAKLNAAERARVKELVSNQGESDNKPASGESKSKSRSSSNDGDSSGSGGSSGGSGGGGGSGSGGQASCGGLSVNAATAAGRAAITFACKQLGDPYVWAADGPSSWDCSGLTMKAFAAGGVSLPHSSRMQANYGTRVSVSNMKAGDLIFFNSPISHTGIYLGNNKMVHAPNSSTVVKVEKLYDTPSVAVRL
jgi:peptidoglycan DL-endopeptidase CwlO